MADDEARRIQRDLVEFARSTTEDLYALLSLSPPATEGEVVDGAALRRAWRQTARKYHPDKNPGFEAHFDLCNKAFHVLSDDEARAAFDGRRRAEQARKEREGKMDDKKREMLRRLHEAEAKAAASAPGVGVKRGRDGSAETEMERKMRELAAKGRKMREERDERLRKEWEESKHQAKKDEHQRRRDEQHKPVVPESSTVEDDDKTVRVQWLRGSPAGDQVDGSKLREVFVQFGPIEDVMILKDRRKRPSKGESKHKVDMGTAAIVFTSIVGAHAAVTDAAAKVAHNTLPLDQVSWLKGDAPDFLASAPKDNSTHGNANGSNGGDARPDAKAAPKFSFKASGSGLGGPASSANAEQAKGKPSSYEITMIKLREAQRAKEERRAKEAAAAAAAAATATS